MMLCSMTFSLNTSLLLMATSTTGSVQRCLIDSGTHRLLLGCALRKRPTLQHYYFLAQDCDSCTYSLAHSWTLVTTRHYCLFCYAHSRRPPSSFRVWFVHVPYILRVPNMFIHIYCDLHSVKILGFIVANLSGICRDKTMLSPLYCAWH